MQIELMGRTVRGDVLTFRTCADALQLVNMDECQTVADVNAACLRAAVDEPEKLRRLVLRVFPEISEKQYERIPAADVLRMLHQVVMYAFFRLASGGEGKDGSNAAGSTGEVLHRLGDALCSRYRMSPFEVYDRPFDDVLQLAEDLSRYGGKDGRRVVTTDGKRIASCPVKE